MKRRKNGWRPQDDEQEKKFKRMVIHKGDEKSVKSLAITEENIETAAEDARKRCRRRSLWEKQRSARCSRPTESKVPR